MHAYSRESEKDRFQKLKSAVDTSYSMQSKSNSPNKKSTSKSDLKSMLTEEAE